MSGGGVIGSRPDGAGDAASHSARLPGVVGRLGADGLHRVCLLIPVGGVSIDPVLMDADAADKLGRELVEYSALVRRKSRCFGRPIASLHEGGA